MEIEQTILDMSYIHGVGKGEENAVAIAARHSTAIEWNQRRETRKQPTYEWILGNDSVAESANAYICETMNIDLPRNRKKDIQAMTDFLSGRVNTLSGEILSAKVGDVSTHNLAETHKHDLPMMLRCCEEELRNMAATGGVAAPKKICNHQYFKVIICFY